MKEKPSEKQIVETARQEYVTSKVFFEIARQNTALLVIDMQEEFVNPEGFLWVPDAYKQVSLLKQLIEACRELGVSVIFTAHMHHAGGLDKGLMFDIWPKIRNGALREGSKGANIYHRIRPLPNEKVIFKHRYSAFYNTDLELILRDLGIETIVISGTMTNYCCLSTVTDGFSRDFKIVFGSDINFSDSKEIQDSVTKTIRRGFGRVLKCREIIRILRTSE